MGDATGDGRVNLNDFNVLANYFGLPSVTSGPSPADWSALAAAVPEPAATALLSFGVAAAAAAMRRRREPDRL